MAPLDAGLRASRNRFASADGLIASMDEAGIQTSIVCGFPWFSQADCIRHNDYFLELAPLFHQSRA